MEDNAGYSREDLINEVIKRKHISINGKDLHIPRKLSDRIFGEPFLDLKRTKIYYKDNGEIWASRCNSYRYRPSALSCEVSRALQHRFIKNFADTLQSAESVKGSPLDDSEVNYFTSLEYSDFQNRASFQKKLYRDFIKKSAF